MINKSASKIGTVRFNNGNEVSFYIGMNSNTGETILWQQFGRIENKFTGKSIAKLFKELQNEILCLCKAKWVSVDMVAYDAWAKEAA